jgi:hypothetical protein
LGPEFDARKSELIEQTSALAESYPLYPGLG